MPPTDQREAYFHQLDDEAFDMVYPDSVRHQSHGHWTPIAVCRKAAEMLVTDASTRVLDIGCGPGKFCAIAASVTPGTFTGVEQREHLVWAAREMLEKYAIPRVEIIHGNVLDIDFRKFDAFYIFNPFQEHLKRSMRIDSGVRPDFDQDQQSVTYVREQLATAPPGTRVVTFWGQCEEIPESYTCDRTAFGGQLILWVQGEGKV